MKTLMPIAALGLIATTSLCTPAQAQIFGGINGAEAQLQSRINAGIGSGRLTRQEAFNLQSKMCRIEALQARFRNSGGLNFRERNILNNELANLSNDVTFQLNDADTRWRNRFHRRGF